MNKATAKLRVRSRFRTQVALVQDLLVIYDNQEVAANDIPHEELYARASIRLQPSRQVSFGASTKRYRTQGQLTVRLYGPLGEGDDDITDLADAIEAAFTSVTDNSVHFLTPSTEEVGRVQNSWQINVVCPFWFEDIR